MARRIRQGRVTTATDCIAASRRLLGAFEGDFDVRATYRAGPTAWDSTTARSRFAWELDGCVLVEHFEGRRYGEPYAYLAIWGTSGDWARPIQLALVHSQHGLLGLGEGATSRAHYTRRR